MSRTTGRQMLRISRLRAFPRVLSIAAIAAGLIVGSSDAEAKSRGKKQYDETATERSNRPSQVAMPPVRFFTINDVLAKRDGKRNNAATFASLDKAGITNDLALAPVAPKVSDEPFGLFTFRAPEGLLWTKWRAVEQSLRLEAAAVEQCRADSEACSVAARRFVAIAAKGTVSDPYERVASVNRTVNNSIRYVGDFEQHGVADRWTAPLATLASGRGDCEDYAILKYAALRAAGIGAGDLRLVLLRDLAVRQDHAVLAVRVEGRWQLLDNRTSAMPNAAEVPHFMPLFAIDDRGVSLFAAPYAARLIHESEGQDGNDNMMPAASLESGASTLSASPLLL